MKVFTELVPPKAILALMLSVISFLSIMPELVSTNKTPYPRFFEILFL